MEWIGLGCLYAQAAYVGTAHAMHLPTWGFTLLVAVVGAMLLAGGRED